MIHAAIFKTTDPKERATLIVSGSAEAIALNVPKGGCWREVPPGCAGAANVPVLGELPDVVRPLTLPRPSGAGPSLSPPGRGQGEG